jgi:hypothetical protein
MTMPAFSLPDRVPIRLVPIRAPHSAPKDLRPTRISCQRRNPKVRPNPLANRFTVAECGSAAEASRRYGEWLREQMQNGFADEPELRVKLEEVMLSWYTFREEIELGCCGEGRDCHCEVLRQFFYAWAEHLDANGSGEMFANCRLNAAPARPHR